MALAFKEVWKDSGVDIGHAPAHANAAMVPSDGANLLLLEGAGAPLKIKPDSHYTVKELGAGNKAAIKTALREVPELAMRSKAEDATSLLQLLPFVGDGVVAAFPTYRLDEAMQRARSGNARLLLLEGRRRGFTKLEIQSGNAQTSILVWVRDGKSVPVNFHFVEDIGPNGKPRQRSKWQAAVAAQWIARLNDIYTPQANITFKLQSASTYPVKKTLPDSVAIGDWPSLGTRASGAAQAHVYLVGKWRGDKNDPLGSMIKATREIVLDDQNTPDEVITTLAHEFGHFLGAGSNFGHPDAGKKDFLMTTVNWRTGAHIPQEYAQHFNGV